MACRGSDLAVYARADLHEAPFVVEQTQKGERMNMSTNKNDLKKTNTTGSATKPTVIACFGASITAAKGSFNWIGELEKRPQNERFRFYNLGVGGDLAYSALQRLPSVVACHPDKVVIIVGHNDIVMDPRIECGGLQRGDEPWCKPGT